MKRALKWILVLVGIPAVAVALLAADACRRAVHAIEVQESRLKADIAALRARRRTTQLLEGRILDPQVLARLPCPARELANAEARGIGYEQGHSGQDSLWFARIVEQFDLARRKVELGPPVPSAQEIVIALAVNERTFQEGGFQAFTIRRHYDHEILELLFKFLVRPGVGASELKELVIALEQLAAARPPIADVIEGERLLDRAEVLRIIPTRSDPHVMLLETPGIREFFSWRVLTVKALNQLEDRYRELRRLDSGSILDWENGASELGLRIRREPAFTRSSLCSEAASILESERLTLCEWKFAQVAALIALFQIEKGRDPAGLLELVPEYLPELPLNPYNGKPFEYRDGALRTAPATSGPQLEWMLRRG